MPLTARQLEDALPSLRRYARHLTRDPDRAADLVQDAALRAWAKRDRYAVQDCPVGSWLAAVMRNVFIDGKRRAKVVRMEPMEAWIDPGMPAEQETAVAMADCRLALAALCPRHARVLALQADGLTYERIARRLGVPLGTARSRLFRARQNMGYSDLRVESP